MVKMFYAELEDEYDEDIPGSYNTYEQSTQFILVKLAEVLVKMPNLVDLRILHSKISDFETLKGTRRISEVIRYVFRSGYDSN